MFEQVITSGFSRLDMVLRTCKYKLKLRTTRSCWNYLPQVHWVFTKVHKCCKYNLLNKYDKFGNLMNVILY
jgi:hypothetical protein